MKAVHFGAGNIGRGFVGTLLHEGGYEVVFSDVSAPLVDALSAAESYTVHEVGAGGQDRVVDNFRALNSAENPEAVAAEVASAQVLTTAVGPNILKFIAPHILAGLRLRGDSEPALQVMACENALGATDTLRQHVEELAGEEWTTLSTRAIFANTAVDRIVPGQPEGAGVDVTVEPFFEWAIEQRPFAQDLPSIPGAHFVEDLGPYIERKLFTVNTGHAAAAYLGARAGKERIAEALADESVLAGVSAALQVTSGLLVDKHGFSVKDMAEYRETILNRFRNPELPDTVDRVGRQPLRKLSRRERLIGPAVEASERGHDVNGLLAVVEAALYFTSPGDEQTEQMQQLLGELDADGFTQQVTGLAPGDPLFEQVREFVAARQS